MMRALAVHAHPDAQLVARVVTSRLLYYSEGDDPLGDRPRHVRAGSGLVAYKGDLYVVQDDANFIAVVRASGRVDALDLPAIDGQRRFDSNRGNKNKKLDLEAVIAVEEAQGFRIIAFGSGSAEGRDRVVELLFADGVPRVRWVRCTPFYEALRAACGGSELNIEGARIEGSDLWLVQRGNGSLRHGPRFNAAFRFSLGEVLRIIEHEGLGSPDILEVQTLEWGAIDGVPLTPTDACTHPWGTLFLAASEDSPNAVDDGPVVGVVVGIQHGAAIRYAPLTGHDGLFLAKAEGIGFDPVDPQRLFVVVDRDDPDRACELLEVRLEGPWSAPSNLARDWASAVCSGWPQVLASFCSEEQAEIAGEALFSKCGELPQAELVEVDDSERPWALELLLPGASLEELASRADVLRACGGLVRLESGRPAGSRSAIVCGVVDEVRWMGNGLKASGLLMSDASRWVVPELFAVDPGSDPQWAELELRVATAFAAVGMGFESSRGFDRLDRVFHRYTGRVGLRLTLTHDTLDEDALRRALVACEGVSNSCVEGAVWRLASDAAAWADLRWTLILWLVTPPVWVPHLTTRGQTTAMVESSDFSVTEYEALILAPNDQDVASWYLRLGECFSEEEAPSSRLPRWLLTDAGWRCVPRWSLAPSSIPAWKNGTRHAAVEINAVVPGTLLGLEERWPHCDVEWFVGSARTLVRVRDGARDRDALPSFQPLAASESINGEQLAEVAGAFGLMPSDVKCIQDSLGTAGLAIAIPSVSLCTGEFLTKMSWIADAEPGRWPAVGLAGWHRDRFLVTLWESPPQSPSGRRWN